MSYAGMVVLESAIDIVVITKNTSTVPTAATGSVTYRVYGDGTLMTNGTGSLSALDSSNVTGGYRVAISALAADGYAAGENYQVVVQATVSGNAWSEVVNFTVV